MVGPHAPPSALIKSNPSVSLGQVIMSDCLYYNTLCLTLSSQHCQYSGLSNCFRLVLNVKTKFYRSPSRATDHYLLLSLKLSLAKIKAATELQLRDHRKISTDNCSDVNTDNLRLASNLLVNTLKSYSVKQEIIMVFTFPFLFIPTAVSKSAKSEN